MITNRPDSFLRMIRRSERGKLKIYLGYCAGVGKTYQMLREARRLKADGIDVAIGLVETHGRKETEALLEGLESIPRRKVDYRGIVTEEMDLDAILARKPAAVLVDELAHTNIPGSRNAKRYQDIEEILNAGIHVISTLNVQHLESLYETVERATGVKVRERVPDRVVTDADQVVNVDVSTEDLRQRLQEGKVYTRERVETALEHFFRSSNLQQLRELTLRELAAQIDSRQRDAQGEEPPATPDQVMVCLSSRGPNSEALLRYASRLAGRLNRNWYAVYVQTSAERPTAIDASTQRTLSNTLALAQQLGATVFTYKGDDVVKTILQFAREYRVGHIVIGSPGSRPSFWNRLLGRQSIVDRLVAESRDMTVVVLDTRSVPESAPLTQESAPPSLKKEPVAEVAAASVLALSPAFWEEVPIEIWLEPVEKQTALRHLMDSCLPETQLRDATWRQLQERENQGSTFVGEDISLPHARIAGMEKPLVAIAIAKAGIHDPETDRSASIMILLLSPQSPPDAHVAHLGEISRMARDDQWRRQVLKATTVDQARKAIRQWVTATLIEPGNPA
jgi:two-component system, OmpR family, sensor histidine kinase KdpD